VQELLIAVTCSFVKIFLELGNIFNIFTDKLEENESAVFYLSPLEQGVNIVDNFIFIINNNFNSGMFRIVAFDDFFPRFNIAIMEKLV
jgi:hypothetical protein